MACSNRQFWVHFETDDVECDGFLSTANPGHEGQTQVSYSPLWGLSKQSQMRVNPDKQTGEPTVVMSFAFLYNLMTLAVWLYILLCYLVWFILCNANILSLVSLYNSSFVLLSTLYIHCLLDVVLSLSNSKHINA